MVTTKPVSTICWNSAEFLAKKLRLLYEKDYITFYCYIFHYAEENETKNHWHLYIVPNGKIDTDKFLREELSELEDGKTMPNRPLPFEYSKFDDWCLYSIHDISFLNSKGVERKFHYSFEDIIGSDQDVLNDKIFKIDLHKVRGTSMFINAIDKGFKFKDLVKSGLVPVQLINQYEKLYDYINGNRGFSVGGSEGGSSTTP